MNKRILLATGVTVLTLAAMGAMHKANAVQGTGDIDAVIVAPIVINCTQNLNFGTASSGAAGTVTMSTGGARGFTGGVTLESMDAGEQGLCDLYGDTGYTVSVEVINSPVTLTSGANTMTVDDFLLAYAAFGPSAADTPLTGVTLAGVTGTNLNVGGTLNVGLNQAAGAYTGSFTVEVLYE